MSHDPKTSVENLFQLSENPARANHSLSQHVKKAAIDSTTTTSSTASLAPRISVHTSGGGLRCSLGRTKI